MKVLGICGSPRKEGNSSSLLAEALRGCEASGAETKIIHVIDLNVSPCIHCDSCLKTGKCIYHDDMDILLKEMDEADLIFISSPLHFANVSSQLKTVIDRMQVLWATKYVLKQPYLSEKKRSAVFITTASRYGDDLFEGSIATIKDFLRCGNIKLAMTFSCPSVENVGDVQQFPIIMKRCFETGKALADIKDN